jgi:cytochrome c oxidase subunit 2
MKQIPASILTLIVGIFVTLVSFWVGQHHGLLPEQASAQAPLVDRFFNVMVTIGTALFLVVQGAILLFTIQFRRRRGDDTDGVPIEGNISLEILWTAIPAIIVIGLGIYSVEVYENMGGFNSTGAPMMAHHHSSPKKMPGSAIAAPLTPQAEPTETQLAQAETQYGIGATRAEGSKPADLTVNVTGLQYAWIFNYPDSGISAGELHVPIGKDVQLNLSAQDVIHSLWIPQFRLKQDAIPGEKTELRFVATKIGSFPIVCTELCGSYHGSMRTKVVVHEPAEFETWLQANRVAQNSDLQQAVAVNPTSLSLAEFLAPYTQAMGVESGKVAQLHGH